MKLYIDRLKEKEELENDVGNWTISKYNYVGDNALCISFYIIFIFF